MITDNEGTTINLEKVPVVIDNIAKQVVNLVIKQDGNEVRLRLQDNYIYGFNALEFFNDFVDALYKEKDEFFGYSYSIEAINSSKIEEL